MTNTRAGLLCVPVIAAWIFFGIVTGQQPWAVLAIAGAFTVSFSAFQKLAPQRIVPMLITLCGIVVATFLGSVAGHYGWICLVIVAAALGYLFGAITLLGYGGWWMGVQCMIAFLVYGAHSAGPIAASHDAMFVLLGGLSQFVFLMIFRPLTLHWFHVQKQSAFDVTDSVLSTLASNLNPTTRAGRYALRVSLALVIGTIVNHCWGMPNGYWVPMTATILLKPDRYETLIRSTNRLAGTLVGAGTMTLLLATLRPDAWQRGVILTLAVWACFTLQRVNYGIFATCVTAYVVTLLSMVGLPEPIVALHRLEATMIGAAIALFVHVIPLGTKVAASQVAINPPIATASPGAV